MSLDRGPDLVLARMHLRLGSLALARAELETMAGQDSLDDEGVLDLAEARWRTGDLIGAGEAAEAVLADERNPVLALVVAAEAAAARGRPSEARRLAARALEAASGSIDATFAGMPRAPIWPADPAAPPPAPTTLFHAAPDPGAPVRPARTEPDAGLLPAAPTVAGALRLWDLPGEPLPEVIEVPEPDAELELAGERLAAGDIDAAAIHLSLVLRLGPALAPAVLDLVAERSERSLAMVRGDAYRLVGRELDARRAFAEAAREAATAPAAAIDESLGRAPDAPEPDRHDHPSEGDPA
jgi:tetratricopeptide (TPR) repeat protein